MEEKKGNFIGLVPFLIFITIYLGTGIVLELQKVESAFYQMPATVALTVGIMVAFAIFKGKINEKFDDFLKGAGEADIMIMCIIFLLAGAFASVSKAMGGVESTVNLCLTYIPSSFITAGIFLIATFISTATGTSVGSIVAIGPIAVGLAEKSGVPMALVLGALVGGSMFGDNLSIISDTTIAATRTQGVEMKDKFRVNLAIALPAATLTFILLILFGKPDVAPETQKYVFNIVKIFPYLVVLGLALIGMNVFVVLTLGILLSGIVGLCYGSFGLIGYSQQIFNGFLGMFDVFVLSILTGGLAALVKKAGGIDWIISKIKRMMSGPKSTLIGIGVLVGIIDISVANNTVAIIIAGPIAKDIAEKNNVDPRKTAAILDIFSCITQGFIPYGGQILIALGFTQGAVSFLDLFPRLWYLWLLLATTLLSIYIPFADGYIKKHPWNATK
ncbi:MAG: Na+/H+ antiporter NhaC family protein [Fusobacteriaceae bacterium]|jgi:Na+/H+ antiporter NhaC|nr:Na+/H+ antiporter NhaC family protein [Fusobacteriaceae bacterium]